MEHIIDPEQFVGLSGGVVPHADDPFMNEFEGVCIGTRNGLLEVRDQDDEVYAIEVSQFTPTLT